MDCTDFTDGREVEVKENGAPGFRTWTVGAGGPGPACDSSVLREGFRVRGAAELEVSPTGFAGSGQRAVRCPSTYTWITTLCATEVRW